jgi:hypothetical protein
MPTLAFVTVPGSAVPEYPYLEYAVFGAPGGPYRVAVQGKGYRYCWKSPGTTTNSSCATHHG